jgi:hypothetical protein
MDALVRLRRASQSGAQNNGAGHAGTAQPGRPPPVASRAHHFFDSKFCLSQYKLSLLKGGTFHLNARTHARGKVERTHFCSMPCARQTRWTYSHYGAVGDIAADTTTFQEPFARGN